MNQAFKKPELLSPAGDMERFESAINFGADAVYIGGEIFGMRARCSNFTFDEMKALCEKAHSAGVKVYLACNTVPRNNEIGLLPGFLHEAHESGVDALIISDMGVLKTAKREVPSLDIHISTQAGITNYESANMFHELGASRVVLARELSLKDIAEIRAKTPQSLEIECFVHGAMCVSFSGRCLLSNYLVNRDSNRGDCAQPCRWQYAIVEQTRPDVYIPIDESTQGTYLMNSKDMCMIEHIPELVRAGISSFKIEGRAKSEYYTAVITNAYRCAIDLFFENPAEDFVPDKWILDEVFKVSTREYCTGFYFNPPTHDASIYKKGGYRRDWQLSALAEHCDGERLWASQRNRFFEGDELEIIEPFKAPYTIKVEDLRNEKGEKIESAPHPMMNFSIKCNLEVGEHAILRKQLEKIQEK